MSVLRLEPMDENVAQDGAADKSAEKPVEKKPALRGGMSAPKVWQRCLFCSVRKKCKEIHTERGSPACTSARYMSKGHRF